jgi:amidohydrolase
MADWREELDRRVDALSEDLVAIRRHLHAHPEPSHEEYRTTRYLAARLEGAGVPHRVVASGRGIVAGPGPGGGRPCVAIRADLDALRLQDAKAVEYRSRVPGVMHACGHDAHAAMVLGAALALHGADLPGAPAWRAVFQPAEEVGEGAEAMVAEGAVEGVDAILALHVDPELDVGGLAVREGVLTAFCQDVRVEVLGRGGHGARPHLSADPIAAAAQFLLAVYQGGPRATDAREPSVVSFGAIHGGADANVIPGRVALLGTLRATGRAQAARLRDRLARIARGVGEAGEVRVEVEFGPPLDAVVNDPLVTSAFARAAAEVVGVARVASIPLPSMGSEDFSAYLARVPGCMLRLGVGRGPRPRPGLHHPGFDIDERALAIGAKVLARGVIEVASDLDEARSGGDHAREPGRGPRG